MALAWDHWSFFPSPRGGAYACDFVNQSNFELLHDHNDYKSSKISKEPSIKKSTVREKRGFVQCGQFAGKGGSSDALVRTFCCKKL